jgi:hypothetical protein
LRLGEATGSITRRFAGAELKLAFHQLVGGSIKSVETLSIGPNKDECTIRRTTAKERRALLFRWWRIFPNKFIAKYVLEVGFFFISSVVS